MSLEKQVFKILNGLVAPFGISGSSRVEEYKDKVMKAIADEGWMPPTNQYDLAEQVKRERYGDPFMLGSEWYERFEKEIMENRTDEWPLIHASYAYSAAKRASGETN